MHSSFWKKRARFGIGNQLRCLNDRLNWRSFFIYIFTYVLHHSNSGDNVGGNVQLGTTRVVDVFDEWQGRCVFDELTLL